MCVAYSISVLLVCGRDREERRDGEEGKGREREGEGKRERSVSLAGLSDFCTGWSLHNALHPPQITKWTSASIFMASQASREEPVLLSCCSYPGNLVIGLGREGGFHGNLSGSSTQLSYVGPTDQSDCPTTVVQFQFWPNKVAEGVGLSYGWTHVMPSSSLLTLSRWMKRKVPGTARCLCPKYLELWAAESEDSTVDNVFVTYRNECAGEFGFSDDFPMTSSVGERHVLFLMMYWVLSEEWLCCFGESPGSIPRIGFIVTSCDYESWLSYRKCAKRREYKIRTVSAQKRGKLAHTLLRTSLKKKGTE